MEGTGVSSSTKYYFTSTGAQSITLSGTVTIASSEDNTLSMTVSIGHGFDATGEGAYTYDESSGTASFDDSLGFVVTLVFTEENGQIRLEMVRVYDMGDATATITLTGPKS